jgi:hypothetical protein
MGNVGSTKDSSSTESRVDPDVLCCGSDPLGQGVFLNDGLRGTRTGPWIHEQDFSSYSGFSRRRRFDWSRFLVAERATTGMPVTTHKALHDSIIPKITASMVVTVSLLG